MKLKKFTTKPKKSKEKSEFRMLLKLFSMSQINQILIAGVTAAVTSIIITLPVIRILRKMKVKDGESKKDSETIQELHKQGKKSETPTMGGIAIFLSILISIFLWVELSAEILIGLFGAAAFFLLGIYDDLNKLRKIHKDGLSSRKKLLIQILISLCVGTALLIFTDFSLEGELLFIGLFDPCRSV